MAQQASNRIFEVFIVQAKWLSTVRRKESNILACFLAREDWLPCAWLQLNPLRPAPAIYDFFRRAKGRGQHVSYTTYSYDDGLAKKMQHVGIEKENPATCGNDLGFTTATRPPSCLEHKGSAVNWMSWQPRQQSRSRAELKKPNKTTGATKFNTCNMIVTYIIYIAHGNSWKCRSQKDHRKSLTRTDASQRVWQHKMQVFASASCKFIPPEEKTRQISSAKLSLHPHLPKLCSQGSIVFLSWKPGSAGEDGCHHSISKKQKISKHVWAGDGITLLMWSAPASVQLFHVFVSFLPKGCETPPSPNTSSVIDLSCSPWYWWYDGFSASRWSNVWQVHFFKLGWVKQETPMLAFLFTCFPFVWGVIIA